MSQLLEYPLQPPFIIISPFKFYPFLQIIFSWDQKCDHLGAPFPLPPPHFPFPNFCQFSYLQKFGFIKLKRHVAFSNIEEHFDKLFYTEGTLRFQMVYRLPEMAKSSLNYYQKNVIADYFVSCWGQKMWPPWRCIPNSTSTFSLPHFLPILIILPICLLLILLSHLPLMNATSFQHHSNGNAKNAKILESQLDANRSILINGERIFVAKTIPKISRAEKRRLILEQFHREGLLPPDRLRSIEWTMRTSAIERGNKMTVGGGRRKQKKRRDLPSEPSGVIMPWRNHYTVRRRGTRGFKPLLMAKNTEQCPTSLDAVTEGFNKRLYMFAGEMVYVVWRDCQGLQQRMAYPIGELFPDGPRRVTVAMTNQKSGVTLLLDWRQVYRFRWNRRHKRFYLAQKSPRQLPKQVDFVPKIGFQWKDGHLILANKDKFISYDPYWNLATFSSTQVAEYFPNLPVNQLAGVVRHGRQTMLWMSKQGGMQIYDLEKHRMGLEFPVNLAKILACLQYSAPSNSTVPIPMLAISSG